jgi:hypothetical protein
MNFIGEIKRESNIIKKLEENMKIRRLKKI